MVIPQDQPVIYHAHGFKTAIPVTEGTVIGVYGYLAVSAQLPVVKKKIAGCHGIN
jgi:hypothetical protein